MSATFLLTTTFVHSALYGCIFFAVVGLIRILYLTFVYPDYVSPLRHLPGPKVCSACIYAIHLHHDTMSH